MFECKLHRHTKIPKLFFCSVLFGVGYVREDIVPFISSFAELEEEASSGHVIRIGSQGDVYVLQLSQTPRCKRAPK